MILISTRKTSPGTTPIGGAVSKVTCFTHIAGRLLPSEASCGALRGSLAPRSGAPGRGQEPRTAYSGLATCLNGETAHSPPPPPPLCCAFLTQASLSLSTFLVLFSPKVSHLYPDSGVLESRGSPYLPPQTPTSRKRWSCVAASKLKVYFASAYYIHLSGLGRWELLSEAL